VRTPAVAARLPVRGPKTSRGSRGSRLGLTPKGLREQPHPRGARKQASGGSRLTPPCQRETFEREGPCGASFGLSPSPFRVFGSPARPSMLPSGGRPLGIGFSFRVPHPPQYRPYWLGGSTLPLAVSSAVWPSCDGFRLVTVKRPDRALSSSFASRQSMPRSNLARRPQPTDTSHGLSVPTAREGSKVHLTRARPPATFRLQGLVTLVTAYSLRSRAGFVSHRQRSWDSPFGAFSSRKVSGVLPAGRTHLPFSLPLLPPP
jgi:hypothetical protein